MFVSRLFQLKPVYSQRVFGLDLMRALAIILVVIGHGGILLEKADTNFPWIRLIDGVELFFVLSGFLIGGILLRLFDSPSGFNLPVIGNFWLRRWFRTLPNYYLLLLVNVVLVYYGLIRGDFSQFNWKFFFFLQNFTQPFFEFFIESWSLSIEEWFYLLFPLILLGLYFMFRKTRLTAKSLFLLAIVLFIIGPLLLRVYQSGLYHYDQFWLGVRIFKVVVFRLDGIALGLLAAFIKHYVPRFWHRSRNISFLLGLGLSYLVLFIEWQPDDFSTKVFQLLIQSLGCFLLLPKFDSLREAPKPLLRVFTHLSLVSYSMYLFNLPLVSLIQTNFPPRSAPAAYLSYLAYWAILVLLSTLLHKFYEKPLMDLRDKWKSRRPSAVPAEVPARETNK